jgi:hypothetical protein
MNKSCLSVCLSVTQHKQRVLWISYTKLLTLWYPSTQWHFRTFSTDLNNAISQSSTAVLLSIQSSWSLSGVRWFSNRYFGTRYQSHLQRSRWDWYIVPKLQLQTTFFYPAFTALYEFEPPHSGRSEITHKDAPQSVGLLWTSDQPVAETSTWQHSQRTTIHTPGGIRTRNPNKQSAVDKRLRVKAHTQRSGAASSLWFNS